MGMYATKTTEPLPAGPHLGQGWNFNSVVGAYDNRFHASGPLNEKANLAIQIFGKAS